MFFNDTLPVSMRHEELAPAATVISQAFSPRRLSALNGPSSVCIFISSGIVMLDVLRRLDREPADVLALDLVRAWS